MDKLLASLNDLYPVVIIFLALFFFRMLLTTLHEAGHAIAIGALTTGKVTIFLGSYADAQKSVGFRLGKYEIWIIKNILKWKGGCCIAPPGNKSIRVQMIYTLGGPIATLLIAGILTGIFF